LHADFGVTKDRSGLYAVFVVCAVAATRILFRSHLLYDIDSVNFALALRRFDPAVHQPHPPGYFLYVCLGRLANMLLPDPNTALVAISIAASCGAAWMIYLLTKEWFGGGPAFVSTVLFLVSPLCWFHGIVALTYIVEAFFSALIGYLCWKVYSGNAAFVIPASLAFAVAAGFRPSTGLLLAPLWLVSVHRMDGRRRWLALLAAGVATAAWFIPMVEASGGINRYFGSLMHLWLAVPGQRTTLSSPALAVARLVTHAWIFILCFGAATPFVFRRLERRGGEITQHTRFIYAWVGPGLLFFTFVYFLYVNSGYLLLVCPPAFAWISVGIYRFARSQQRRLVRRAVLAGGVAVNCAIFLCAPIYCSHKGVRDFERDLAAVRQDFGQYLDPANTLIIGFDSHFLGYRHAGFYLPSFATVQYPEVPYSDGPHVFLMRNGETEVVRSFVIDRFEHFVFFPLPEGSEYSTYVNRVLAGLPAGVVNPITVGKRKVLAGPAWAIPLMFRSTAQCTSTAKCSANPHPGA
jgi:hypothetical protein